MVEKKYGWYSKDITIKRLKYNYKNINLEPIYCIYLNKNGKEIKVNFISENKNYNEKMKHILDLECVGIVTEWVRNEY